MDDELLLTPGMAAMVEPYLRMKSGTPPSKELRPGQMGNKLVKRRKRVLSEQQNHRCANCGIRFSDDPTSTEYATLDHFIGRGFGGPNCMENLALLCQPCNNRRNCSIADVEAVFG